MVRGADSSDLETSEPLIEKTSVESSRIRPCSACSRRQATKVPIYARPGFWLSYINALILITSVFFFVRRPRSEPLGPMDALKANAAYTPVYDMVDMAPITKRVDGRLHTSSNSSVFRGDPGPQTDAAWDDLAAEAYEVILVDGSTLTQAGYTPDHYFKAPTSWNYGDDAFPVQIDVFHQIHCLNALRKQMHYDYYYAEKFGQTGPDDMHWMHQKHCLHMILQSITCNANADIIPHRWVEKDKIPFAQFSIDRKCKNFDALSEWNKEHAIHNVREVWSKAVRPENAFVWPGFGEL